MMYCYFKGKNGRINRFKRTENSKFFSGNGNNFWKKIKKFLICSLSWMQWEQWLSRKVQPQYANKYSKIYIINNFRLALQALIARRPENSLEVQNIIDSIYNDIRQNVQEDDGLNECEIAGTD